ncbi:MAG: glycosyltransferase family 1 protein [Mastigocoleus sp. MO_167.B18]|nr:glycosyltransferase family 1 protein [Mastigocoleus sp. MO_167.B18]
MGKILINLSIVFSQPTGISNYATNLVPHLQSLQPTLLTAKDYSYPDFNCYSIPNNLTPAQGTKGHLYRLWWTQLQLPKIYKSLESQLLFSPLPEAPLYNRCRYVVTVHDVIPLRFPKRFSPLTPYHRYYIPEVLKQAEHVICNSMATARDITDFLKIPANKITPIPLAYDVNCFQFHKNANTHHNKQYFIYIGQHKTHKNVHRLIKAFAGLAHKKDYQLWIAGSRDKRYTPHLQQLATELGVGEQVKFFDYVSAKELPDMISQAVALVFPSLWEGFGFPVLEAMACGTPVITSNISSLPEVAGDAAILIDPYNHNEITAAMESLASDRQLRSHLSQKGLEQASKFTWEKTGKATAEILSRFI